VARNPILYAYAITEEGLMLNTFPVNAMIPAQDLDRATEFYSERLGLTPSAVMPGVVRYDCADGTWFALFLSETAGGAEHTVANWTVDNLQAEVLAMKEMGIVFENDENDDLTADPVASISPPMAAWFKDSEGNRLGLVQAQ